MSSGFSLIFRGITRAIFKRLRRKAAQNGITVVSQTGDAVKDGIQFKWKYDPDAQLLEVDCVRAPFWIDTARIRQNLSDEIDATLKNDRAA